MPDKMWGNAQDLIRFFEGTNAGFAIFFSGFFTALNDGLTSAMIFFMRTLVFQIAAVMLLPLVWGINGIWWSIVVAEAMAVVVGGIQAEKVPILRDSTGS